MLGWGTFDLCFVKNSYQTKRRSRGRSAENAANHPPRRPKFDRRHRRRTYRPCVFLAERVSLVGAIVGRAPDTRGTPPGDGASAVAGTPGSSIAPRRTHCTPGNEAWQGGHTLLYAIVRVAICESVNMRGHPSRYCLLSWFDSSQLRLALACSLPGVDSSSPSRALAETPVRMITRRRRARGGG